MDTTCTGCGIALSTAAILYTSDAKPVCQACSANADLLETDKRAANNIVKAGWGAIAAGVLSCAAQVGLVGIVAYFFVAGSIISAAYAFKSLSAGNERFSKHLSSGQQTTTKVCALVGLVFASLTVFGIPFRLAYGLF